jgi:hypothetical protein
MGISVSIFKVTKCFAFSELKVAGGQIASGIGITSLSMGLEISCLYLPP